MLKFTEDHEWIRVEGSVGTVGITDFAQDALGDIVFVELPEIGRQVAVGDEAAVIESVKAAGEVKSPVSGEVVEVNQALVDEPSLMNTAPESDGWVYKVQLADVAELDGLMDEAAYRALPKNNFPFVAPREWRFLLFCGGFCRVCSCAFCCPPYWPFSHRTGENVKTFGFPQSR